MNFFFDNCVAPRYAEAIHALISPDGSTAVHLRDKFTPSTSDVDWISALASEGNWIIVSGDMRITRNKHERAVIPPQN